MYERITVIDPAPGGDSVKSAILDLDTDLTAAYTAINEVDTDVTANAAALVISLAAKLDKTAIDTDVTLAANSDVKVSSQKAVKTLVAATAFSTALPAQDGNAGKFVTTDGTNAGWAEIVIPDTMPFSNNTALSQVQATALSF